MADETPVKQKQREPITLLFSVILLAACIIAIGIFISDHVVGDDGEKVTSSMTKVEVDYTGSLYGYYDEGGSIFQTTVSSIDGNEDYRFTPTYSFNSSTLTVDMSNPTVLPMFAEALLGHEVGDKVRVAIPADQAYKTPENYEVRPLTSLEAFNMCAVSSLDGLDTYNWTYTSTYDDATGLYTISYTMKNEDVCTAEIDGVTYKTSNFVINGGIVTYDLSVSGVALAKNEKGESYTYEKDGVNYTAIESFAMPGYSQFYVVGAENVSDGTISGNILIKSSALINNMPLFFVIKILSME
jgi:hypothetical protein